MGSFFKLFYIFTKRLYRKAAFIITVLLIPVSVFCFSLVSNEKSGFVHIALINHDTSGTGEKIVKDLGDSSSIILFDEYKDETAALDDLKKSRLDAVWVFPEKIDERIANFAKDHTQGNYIVNVYFQESSIKVNLSLEKLSGVLYPYLSRQFYLNHVRSGNGFNLSRLSDAAILKEYDAYINNGSLFKFTYPDKSNGETNKKSYLTSPVRGLLSVVMMLCGLSCAAMFIKDDKKGVFSHTKSSSKIFVSLMMQFTALVNIGIFVFCSLFILGVNVALWREIVIMIMFIINATLFCTLLQQIINNIKFFIPTATFLTVLQTLVCPIFFDFKSQRLPQMLFPPSYYVNLVHSNTYFVYSLIYTAVLSALLFAIYLKKKKE